MDFNNALSKILGNDKSIEEVHIDSKLIDEIVKIAINADPNEYVALLSGDIEENILKIKGLIFLPFKASSSSAVMEVFMMPMTTNAVGSIHSHPGPSANPSQADLTFFAKNGYFHMIICRPYSESTIKAYDAFGNPMSFKVKDLGGEIDLREWEDLGIDEELLDEDLVKELEKLENENDIDVKEEKLLEEDIKLSQQENNPVQENTENKKHTLNLEFEMKGKKYVEEIPLPPEYEPGDQVDIDIRTDKTPNDEIDEIRVNVRKVPKNVNKNSKVITITPQKVSSIQQPEVKPNMESIESNKSSEEIENEIKEMEKDIARLKAENERLKKNL
ncbi:MAG: hypothetical protein E7Z85_01070 [Methanosphaera stadtmanae]|nr:hypothetical protein [Methanosphaera stadtmanae]